MRGLLAVVVTVFLLSGIVVAATIARGPSVAPEQRRHDGSYDELAGRGGGSHDDDEDEDGDDEDADDEDLRLVETFADDPLGAPGTVVAGLPLERLAWQDDEPAFAGDRPGSLTARYDSTLPPGLFGFDIGPALDQDDRFTAAAVLVVSSSGFSADPNGFFQISWGLWNQAATGLDRTGSFADFAADTFELVGFDWFPNVSPFFGGPFLAPHAFGVANPAHPDFPFSGAFANFTSLFGLEVALPFDTPLLAVVEHGPGVDALTAQVYEIRPSGDLVPLTAAVGVAALDVLTDRHYELDAAGLLLWQDGFSGPTPAVVADVTFHRLVVVAGEFAGRPQELLDVEQD